MAARVIRSVVREIWTGNTIRAHYELAAGRGASRAQVDGYPRNHENDEVQTLRQRHMDTLIRDVQDAQSVLDIGCGTGMYLEQLAMRFPQIALYGVDISRPTLDKFTALAVPTATLAACDVARDVPFRGRQFDVLYAIAVLQNVHPIRLARFLRHLRVAAAPGAQLILAFPPGQNWQDQWAMRGFYRYEPGRVGAGLLRAGFCDVAVEPLDLNQPQLGYVARARVAS